MRDAHTFWYPFLGYLGGLAVAIVVTISLHQRGGYWGRRLGRSVWRRANLPVGGAVLAVAALLAGSSVLVGVALGLAVGAVGCRFVDPLPPVR